MQAAQSGESRGSAAYRGQRQSDSPRSHRNRPDNRADSAGKSRAKAGGTGARYRNCKKYS